MSVLKNTTTSTQSKTELGIVFDALKSAMAIDNSYQKAQSVLYILAKQITPQEVSLVE